MSNKFDISLTSVTEYATDSIKKVLSNDYVSTILIVLAILYGSLAAPKLPANIVKIVKHPVFLFVALVGIAYLASRNGTVALVAGIAVCITLIGLNDGNKIVKVLRNGKVEYLEVTDTTTPAPETTTEVPETTTEVPETTTPAPETTTPVPETTLPAVTELPKENVVEARVEGTPVVTEAPKMVVSDNEGKPVQDDTGKVVVATPTVAVDETGKVVVGEENKPVLVPPKAAITETGEVAKDQEGKVIVAPAIVQKDEKGEVKQDMKGRIMVNSCMVSVDGGNSVQLLYRTRGRKATGGKGLYDDFGMMFGTSKTAQENRVSQVCVGDDCLDGYEPACLAPL
jgi:hypothetical protein